MAIAKVIKNLLLQFVASITFSIFGFFCFVMLNKLFIRIGIEISFGGCKSDVLFGLFFGMPIGNLIGILLTSKIYLIEYRTIKILSYAIGFIFGAMGAWVNVLVLDKISGIGIFYAPLIISFFTIVGYNLSAYALRTRKRN